MSAARTWILLGLAGLAAAVLLCASSGAAAISSSAVSAWRIASGSAYAEALSDDGSTLYVGGDFDQVTPNLGSFAVDDATDVLDSPVMPAVGGTVEAVVGDGSGGWYIGGDFSSVGAEERADIAHIAADGTVDPEFDPGADGTVVALALHGTTLYAGGQFTHIGGEPRDRIAALGASTGTPTSWDPGADGSVDAIALSPDGSVVYAGGEFSGIAGTSDYGFAALGASTGSVPDGWTYPAPDGYVYSAVVAGDGTVYLGGNFGWIGAGADRREQYYLAALHPDGTLDTDFFPDSFWSDGSTTNGDVYALALSDSETSLYAGGSFGQIGGCNDCSYVAALDPASGQADQDWLPRPDGDVHALAVSGTDVVAGGSFESVLDGTVTRSRLVAVDAGGTPTEWDPAPANDVHAVAVHGSSVGVGGSGNVAATLVRSNAFALDTGTGRPTAWNPDPNGNVLAVAVSGSAVYLGGEFTGLPDPDNPGSDPLERRYLAAVGTDGAVSSWNPGPDNYVRALAVSGSTIYFGGDFTAVGTDTRNHVAAVDAGSNDALAFDPNADNTVRALAVDGTEVYAGGDFASIGGETRDRLAALDSTTGEATSWNPEALGPILAIAVGDSAVYAGGYVSDEGGNHAHLAKFDRSTGATSTWAPQPDGYVVDALLLSGSSLLAGGDFATIGATSVARNRVAELDTTTGDATSWNPQLAGPDSFGSDVGCVFALALAGDTLAVAGSFDTVGGHSVPNVAVFATDDSTPTTTTATSATATTTATTTTAAPATPPSTTTTTATTTQTTATAAAPVVPAAAGSISVATGTQEVIVAWQPGAVVEPAIVSVALAPLAVTGIVFQAGTEPVQLTVTSASGAPITSFAQPLEILFPNAPVGFEPAYSSDGRTWINLPQLAGTTLPAGFRDGWYRDGAGTVHVLTRHATYFGMVDVESAEGAIEEANEVVFAYTHPLRLARTHLVTVSVRPELPSTAVAVLRRAGRVAAQAKAPAPANATTKLRLRVARAGTYRLTLVVSAGRERFVRVVSISAK